MARLSVLNPPRQVQRLEVVTELCGQRITLSLLTLNASDASKSLLEGSLLVKGPGRGGLTIDWVLCSALVELTNATS
jgi:hypothetical protein